MGNKAEFPLINSTTNSFGKENELGHTAQLKLEGSGIEMNMMMMVVPTTASYTSLKDIMPPHPTSSNASWNEIPNIKNPLLKHAALAYLQPISTPSHVVANRSFLENLREKCFFCRCGAAAAAATTPQSGCFPWLFTLLEGFIGFFCDRRIRMIPNEDQRHEHNDDDDDDDEDEDNVV